MDFQEKDYLHAYIFCPYSISKIKCDDVYCLIFEYEFMHVCKIYI